MLHVRYTHDQVNLVNKKYLPRFSVVQNNFSLQWRIQERGPGRPSPPLLLDQTEVRRAENFFLTRPFPPPPPPSLSQGLDDRTPSLYLKVWVHH